MKNIDIIVASIMIATVGAIGGIVVVIYLSKFITWVIGV